MKFKSLAKTKTKMQEDEVNKYWDSIDILNATIKNRENNESFVFFEGPPTANNLPGIHHVISRDLKDSICKYKTMKGFKVLRKAGWDTHGLPVEIEVEKALGLKDKTEIEKYGIKEFNEKCKESVWKYKGEWEKMTREMGYFIDMDHPYITFDNDYIETEWHILDSFFKKGLIYQGHKIMPYCSRCGTGLASHEVAQGYQEDTVTSVYVPMKLVNEKNTYLLVWTTTPWTLLSNVAVCVNPIEYYVKVKSGDNYFIISEKLMGTIFRDNYEVVDKFLGKDLEFQEYEQLLPFIKVDKKAFFVVCDSYVTMDDGTGLVHIAPAFGEDDYNVGKRYDLPVVNPVGENGRFLEGPWKDKFVIDTDNEIIDYLKQNDKLFKKEKMVHNYPHCWRCKTPLLYYAKPSWYIKMTDLKDKLVANNNTVNWFPDFAGEKRFGNWLENINDWALSRNRYWGTPLNLWTCECGHIESIGSRKELVEKSLEKIDESIELHRPYVDDVHIKCPKCNKTMNRVSEVIDCWFDSGAMPFAQYHYPFENKEIFNNQFPADFICEGIDQTRGWFYTLLAISTFVMDQSPYKNVLVNDHILDKNGLKMSKSRGNGVNPFDLFEIYGADAARWYLLYVSPVWFPTRFNEEGLKEVVSKFFNTLKNTYTFFELYANTDNIDPRDYKVKYEDLDLIDKWLLSKYNNLIKNVDEAYEKYDLNKVTHLIQDFVCEDLSNWYIRRNRGRFWGSELDNSKKAVYQTTYEVLVGLSKLIAPTTPFLSELLYRNLTDEKSVHLADFPKYDESLIDLKLEEKMDLVRNLISIGRMVREENKIKVRQPLSECLIDGKNKSIIDNLTSLIKEELNIKKVTFVDNLNDYMHVNLKPNFKEVGKTFGSLMKEFQNKLENLTNEDITKLQKEETIILTLSGKDYEITKDMVEIRVSSKEGFNAGMENNNFIILNTTLTEDLVKEGLARELVSRIQQIRKSIDLNVVDRIKISYEGPEEVKEVFNEYEKYIKEETLALEILVKESLTDEYDINDYKVKLFIEKV